jgi:hypothetical protein
LHCTALRCAALRCAALHCAALQCAALRAQVLVVVAARPSSFYTLLVNSFMAYAVNLTNFLVTKYTSALTLQVCVCVWRGVAGVGGSVWC